MFARVLFCGVALCALALASSADEPKKPKEKDTPLKPTLLFTGSHSAVQKTTFFVVSNEKDWQKVWKRHRGDEANRLFAEACQDFSPDFETHYVIAAFFGDWSEATHSLYQRGEAVALRYRVSVPQTAEGVDRRSDIRKAQDATTAYYTFVMLPKPVKTVVIEENVQRQLGEPPIWTEQKRFPAPKDRK